MLTRASRVCHASVHGVSPTRSCRGESHQLYFAAWAVMS